MRSDQKINLKNVVVYTGSSETEGELRLFLRNARTLYSGVPRKIFGNDYSWKVMTSGRNGPGDPYDGSAALDDTGGFFEVRDDGLVYLTDKAKGCVRDIGV